MEKFDLHIHSNMSDGTFDPEAIPALAKAQGVCYMALTDHDTAAGCKRAIAAGQALAAADEARRAVLPDATDFEELAVNNDSIDYCYKGLANGETKGYTAQITVKGYGGEIEIVVGVDNDGVITGINVGGANFSETAGLGAKTKEPAFTEQFKGLSAPLTLKGNVDSVSGASVSSGAIVNGVNTVLDYVAGLEK